MWFLAALWLALLMSYLALRTSRAHSGGFAARITAWASAVLTVILVVMLRPHLLDSAIVTSESMLPTLHVQDRIFVNKISYKFREPRYGDIVIFDASYTADNRGGNIYIKRIIGLPGDVIEARNGAVYRNGGRLDEPYISEWVDYTIDPVKVPQDMLFVLGDNRNESMDSHVWGPLNRKRVLGKAMVRFWPPNRIGLAR